MNLILPYMYYTHCLDNVIVHGIVSAAMNVMFVTTAESDIDANVAQ